MQCTEWACGERGAAKSAPLHATKPARVRVESGPPGSADRDVGPATIGRSHAARRRAARHSQFTLRGSQCWYSPGSSRASLKPQL
eukprot:3976058-Pleurochrysis_carterae.AAC.2